MVFQDAAPLFRVYDVPASIAFYRDLLGFQVVTTSEPFDDRQDNFGWAMLRRDGVMLMVNNMYEDNVRPAIPDAARRLVHRDTVLYITCRELEEVLWSVQSRGISVQGPVNTDYGMRQVTVSDPDGYTLCFQWPIAAG